MLRISIQHNFALLTHQLNPVIRLENNNLFKQLLKQWLVLLKNWSLFQEKTGEYKAHYRAC